MSLVSRIDDAVSRIATEFNTLRGEALPYDDTTLPTTGQTIKFNGTNFVPVDFPAGGPAGKALDFYKARKNSTAQTVGATYADLTGWVQIQSCTFGSFDISTGIFTFSADATCLVIPDVQSTQVSGSNRTQLQVQIMEDVGSGFAVDETKKWFNYSQRNATQNDGGVTPSYIESYASGDKIKIQVSRVGINVDIQENQARFTIVKLEGIQGPAGPAGQSDVYLTCSQEHTSIFKSTSGTMIVIPAALDGWEIREVTYDGGKIGTGDVTAGLINPRIDAVIDSATLTASTAYITNYLSSNPITVNEGDAFVVGRISGDVGWQGMAITIKLVEP